MHIFWIFCLLALGSNALKAPKMTYLRAGPAAPGVESVPHSLNRRLIASAAEAVRRDVDAQLLKREEVITCGVFDIYIATEITEDYKYALCYAAREIVSSRIDMQTYGLNKVRIFGEFKPLGPNILGGAGPTGFCRDASDDTLKPQSLFRLRGTLLTACAPVSPQNYDIYMQFTTAGVSWYTNPDGKVPSGSYDFITVVAHEILHGIGITTFVDFDVGSSTASYAASGILGKFDALITPPISTVVDSEEGLYDWATNTLNIDFQNFMSTGNKYPFNALFTPATAQPGSSVAHWSQTIDDSAPPTCAALGLGACNSMMRPALPNGLSIHRMGGNTMNLLANIGYTMTDCPSFTTMAQCIGDPDQPGPRCDWCNEGFCTEVTMIDYIWTKACVSKNFTFSDPGVFIAPDEDSSSALEMIF